MRTALRLTGLPDLRKRLTQARTRGKRLLREATGEAVLFLEDCAQGVLDAAIYNKTRAPFAEAPTYELYKAFVQRVEAVGMTAAGTLTNNSPHAAFLEFGTDDEGTGEHYIPVVIAKALHWVNPETGADMFATPGIFVHGIHPVHFMERALDENRAAVVEIYRAKFAGLFD